MCVCVYCVRVCLCIGERSIPIFSRAPTGTFFCKLVIFKKNICRRFPQQYQEKRLAC